MATLEELKQEKATISAEIQRKYAAQERCEKFDSKYNNLQSWIEELQNELSEINEEIEEEMLRIAATKN